jgi:hypothetical protein
MGKFVEFKKKIKNSIFLSSKKRRINLARTLIILVPRSLVLLQATPETGSPY